MEPLRRRDWLGTAKQAPAESLELGLMKIGAAEMVFWLSLGAVAYSYILYPLLLILLASIKQTARDLSFLGSRQNRRNSSPDTSLPSVALLCAAHNEENVIEDKLRNTAQLDYPAERLEFFLGLDAPTDSTSECARRILHPSFRIVPFAVRRGKLAVVNDLVQRTSADILVFSDANTMLSPDALRKLVRHFADPKVGAVCGELLLVSAGTRVSMESLYWRYEKGLKFLENRLNCVLGANGAVYAIRRSLYHPRDRQIIEDFQLPMEIRHAGYRVVYDPESTAVEEVAPSLSAEFHRRVRIGAGDCQTLLHNPRFLNPFKGLPAVAYFSHKCLRWLVPPLLLLLLVSNIVLARQPLYAALLAAQVLFYLLAAIGWLRHRAGSPGGLTGAALYFTVMNAALLLGFVRYLTGRQKTIWASTPRQARAANDVQAEPTKKVSPLTSEPGSRA
jgi:cellulose synthase/poly-beta-1,6-N-acetylglucosamine synthase-like glycosyltransferase